MSVNTVVPLGFSSFIGKVGSDCHSTFVKSSRERDLERSQRLLVTYVCGYVQMQVRCLSGMSRKWVTFYPRFDSLMGWGGTSATNQTCSKKNTREKFDDGTGWEEESSQKGYKKHSRKDVASYISNALLEISERQELGAEENLDGKREEYGEENTLARKKVIRCSASWDRLQGVVCSLVASVNLDSRKWNLCCGASQCQFLRCICVACLYSRTRFPRFRVVGLFLSHASRHARYF